jgi:DNA mismatch endonuclease, patch repair protein
MRQIKSTNNRSTEAKLANIFRQFKIRGWRKNYCLFGKPDFVFLRQRVAIFVDGCFWHGHPEKCRIPASNRAYWIKKIARNMERDKLVTWTLRKKGWKVLRIWEDCVAKGSTLARIRKVLS